MALTEHGDHNQFHRGGFAHDDVAHVLGQKLREALGYLHMHILLIGMFFLLDRKGGKSVPGGDFSIIEGGFGCKQCVPLTGNVL